MVYFKKLFTSSQREIIITELKNTFCVTCFCIFFFKLVKREETRVLLSLLDAKKRKWTKERVISIEF